MTQNSPRRKAVFLDRDGVINEMVFREGKPRAPRNLGDFRFCPGVPEAVKRLQNAGYLTIIVTNQPDVSRGWVTRESVDEINEWISRTLQLDAVEVCFHDRQDQCECRKPQPGMLLRCTDRWPIDFSSSYMIGDRYIDVEAGTAAGCTSVLVGPGEEQDQYAEPAARVSSLFEAAEWILSR